MTRMNKNKDNAVYKKKQTNKQKKDTSLENELELTTRSRGKKILTYLNQK